MSWINGFPGGGGGDSPWPVAVESGVAFEAITAESPVTLVNGITHFEKTNMMDGLFPTSGTVTATAFSKNGLYAAIGYAWESPFITIFKFTGNTVSALPRPVYVPGGKVNSLSFSSDGKYLAVGTDSSPYLIIYKIANDVFTRITSISSAPSAAVKAVAFAPYSDHLAVGTTTSGGKLLIYKTASNDAFTKLANPAVMPQSDVNALAYTLDGAMLAVGGSGASDAEQLRVYKKSSDTYTKHNAMDDAARIDTDGNYDENVIALSFAPIDKNGHYPLAVATDLSGSWNGYPFMIFTIPTGTYDNVGGASANPSMFGGTRTATFSPDGGFVEAGGTLFSVEVSGYNYYLTERTEYLGGSAGGYALTFSATGKRILAADGIWDAAEGRRVTKFSRGTVPGFGNALYGFGFAQTAAAVNQALDVNVLFK